MTSAPGSPSSPTSIADTIQSFEWSVSSKEINQLRNRLLDTRWPDELNGVDWTYGTQAFSLDKLLLVPEASRIFKSQKKNNVVHHLLQRKMESMVEWPREMHMKRTT
jgi:hypothetical protein